MSPKKIITLSVFGIIIVYIYALAIDFNGCGKGLECYPRLMGSTIISPFFNTFLALILGTAPFIYLENNSLYRTWKKVFFVWLSVVFITLIFGDYSLSSEGFGVGMTVVNKEIIYVLSVLFILISWSIALWGFVKERKKQGS